EAAEAVELAAKDHIAKLPIAYEPQDPVYQRILKAASRNIHAQTPRGDKQIIEAMREARAILKPFLDKANLDAKIDAHKALGDALLGSGTLLQLEYAFNSSLPVQPDRNSDELANTRKAVADVLSISKQTPEMTKLRLETNDR